MLIAKNAMMWSAQVPKAATVQGFTVVECSDFGYLASGNGCCDDAEDFLYWRYSAVNRKTLVAALACALLALSTLGCQTDNHLQSITLNVSQVNGAPVTGEGGFVTLQGNGGTLQLQAIGNYSNGKTLDVTSKSTFTAIVDPIHDVDAFGNTLLPPCQTPACPNPSSPPYTAGTLAWDSTGLITAVEPATCTWINEAPLVNGEPGTPAWFYTGDYVITATFEGITSQPIYIPIASSGGNQYYDGQENNPSGACGPSSS